MFFPLFLEAKFAASNLRLADADMALLGDLRMSGKHRLSGSVGVICIFETNWLSGTWRALDALGELNVILNFCGEFPPLALWTDFCLGETCGRTLIFLRTNCRLTRNVYISFFIFSLCLKASSSALFESRIAMACEDAIIYTKKYLLLYLKYNI